ncbi:DUF305 domain-containing protein [Streptomyces actuosus]|uniref:DUF305 domain-containing protein n=1 Tax=Streptomyces actuosus TaxID=1885 RepID=UPI003F687B16
MSSTRTLARRAGLAAVAVTAAALLAACGSGQEERVAAAPSASAAPAEAAHNAQDVAFAQGMIPHHRQALRMAELAAGRASSAQVQDLASRIRAGQDPEITTMSGWLTVWGEDVPQGASAMPGMPGMMGGQDMAKLEKASGEDFDTQFLSLMIEHHKGAVDMARSEQDQGRYGPAKVLAGAVVSAQNAEIKEMTGLLGRRS